MLSSRLGWAVIGVVAVVGGALACGPFFPWQLFDDRAATVSDPVGLSFAFEVKRLLPSPTGELPAVEVRDPYDRGPEPEVVLAERAEATSGVWAVVSPATARLSPDELLPKLEAARRANDGKAVFVDGAGLPAPVLDYIAGAVEFRAGRLEAAAKYFEAIERLPPAERRLREVAAVYMLGRIHQQKGELAAARRAFQSVRAKALAGAPDPMGLAVASLGEEARVDLVQAGVLDVPWQDSSEETGDNTKMLIGRAVRLYLEQAARGSDIALLSLRDVASLLIADDGLLSEAVADSLVRRLLVAYVVARDGQSIYDEPLPGKEDPVVMAVAKAVLDRAGPASGDEIDRLAALAYQAGRYDVAEKLTEATSRPLGLWIRAKLALRRDDRAAAVRDWGAALKATAESPADAKVDSSSETRLRGETAVINVSVGSYVESLRLLFPVAGTYWGDVAYIAERVLTVDELKAFVDSLPPSSKLPPPTGDEFLLVTAPVESLRNLLARRLVREGRLDEALPYYSQEVPRPTTGEEGAQARPISEEARAYRDALEAARPGWPWSWPWQDVSRAEALFTAATLARKKGMELMGTEGPPDVAALDGMYSGGVGQASPLGDYVSRDQEDKVKKERALFGPDEESRFNASAPKPDIRFHYRIVASDQAAAAADFLPQRSQAYAAVLCWAARYAIDGNDQPRADRIYRRYVSTGAYQPWAKAFGGTCPQPDFEAARSFWPRQITGWFDRLAGSVGRHPVVVAVAVVLAGLMLAGAIRLRRAGRRPAPGA